MEFMIQCPQPNKTYSITLRSVDIAVRQKLTNIIAANEVNVPRF